MKMTLKFKTSLTFIVLLIFLSNIMVYSQNNTARGSQGSPLKLEYSFSDGRPVKYSSSSRVIQTMDINGQSMQANVYSAFGCTLNPAGKENGNLKLEVKIDTMGQRTESPQGYTGGATIEAIGKTFSITISPSGKETDISEAKKIIFNVEGSGQNDLAETFFGFFPDLPEKPASPGYEWTTTDTVNTKSAAVTTVMVVKSGNRFDGIETLDGTECAKIVSVLSGTRDMKIQTQGMDIKMAGPFTGSASVFFSPSKGYFIKQEITMKMTGTMEITYPEAISFPLVFEMNSVNEVVK